MPNNSSDLSVRERIVIALDVATSQEALYFVDKLAGRVGLFKIGKQLFTSEGPSLAREIIGRGEKVFLDLKYHDIPNTVAGAVAAATKLGVSILNVHCSGGSAMMQAAAAAATNAAEQAQLPRPIVLGVTVLTSIDNSTLHSVGVNDDASNQVIRLARLAKQSGLDGVVASPLEIHLIRAQVASEDFVILTPGIRPGSSSDDDQKRVATPRDALQAGADYLVIGRPITAAPDPIEALEKIVAESR